MNDPMLRVEAELEVLIVLALVSVALDKMQLESLL